MKLVDKNNREFKWECLVKLHQHQEREGLLAGNRIRKQHVYFHNRKMSVPLAVQLLSLSSGDDLT